VRERSADGRLEGQSLLPGRFPRGGSNRYQEEATCNDERQPTGRAYPWPSRSIRGHITPVVPFPPSDRRRLWSLRFDQAMPWRTVRPGAWRFRNVRCRAHGESLLSGAMPIGARGLPSPGVGIWRDQRRAMTDCRQRCGEAPAPGRRAVHKGRNVARALGTLAVAWAVAPRRPRGRQLSESRSPRRPFDMGAWLRAGIRAHGRRGSRSPARDTAVPPGRHIM
jgi:hypothetical protein